MAASNYTPPQGRIQVVDGYQTIKKYPRSKQPRAFPAGTPLWLNKVSGRYQVEPALLTPVNAGNDASMSGTSVAVASTYSSLALAQAAFAPLFAGFAAEGAAQQQFFVEGQFNAPGPSTLIPVAADDASRDFIAVYDEGVAIAPIDPVLMGITLATAVEVGALVSLGGFVNEEASGFYDPAGVLQVADTDYWMYNNAVTVFSTGSTAITAADAIGVVCERAVAGQNYIKFKFKSAVLSPASVL